MVSISIEVHHTYFKIKLDRESAELDILLASMKKDLTDFEYVIDKRGNRRTEVKALLYHKNRVEHSYIFPITLLKHALTLLHPVYKIEDKQLKYFKNDDVKDFKFLLNQDYVLRDYQVKYVDICVGEKSPSHVLIDLQPGKGKTFISVNAIHRLGMKTAIVILPKYIEKWQDDFKKYTNVTDDDVYVVSGGESIENILEGKTKDKSIFIISIRTMYYYMDKYEKDPTIPSPTEVFKQMGVGLIVSDESHQETSTLTRIVMYSNVRKVIGLSATYVPNTPKDGQIQSVLFPRECIASNIVNFDAYINAVEVTYLTDMHVKLPSQTNYGYSHIKYEQSIDKLTRLRIKYFDMVIKYLMEYYLTIKQDGEKALIFFSSIKMCTSMQSYLQSRFKELKIRRYVGEDPYEHLLEGDVVVTTLQSAGTAVDVPNLICVLNTVIVGSNKINIQATGRLRKIEGRPTTYVYFKNDRNKSHKFLCQRREKAISPIIASLYRTTYGLNLNNF